MASASLVEDDRQGTGSRAFEVAVAFRTNSTRRIVIRDMTRADLRQVQRIERAAYSDAWSSRTFESELRNGFARYLVAVERPRDTAQPGVTAPLPAGSRRTATHRLSRSERDHIVGFAGVWYMVDQMHLVTIAVDPKRQGRGIGQRLLFECFDLARAAELPAIVLEVRPSNERAQALYEHFGFRRTGRLRGYYKDNGEDAIVMLTPDLRQPELRERLRRLHREHRERFGALFAP